VICHLGHVLVLLIAKLAVELLVGPPKPQPTTSPQPSPTLRRWPAPTLFISLTSALICSWRSAFSCGPDRQVASDSYRGMRFEAGTALLDVAS
jgi:hypothetical protein